MLRKLRATGLGSLLLVALALGPVAGLAMADDGQQSWLFQVEGMT